MRNPLTRRLVSDDSGDDFWRFSLALYARPGVAPALIELQDRDGRDVNLILVALWFGLVGGKRLGAASLAALDRGTAPIRLGLVAPLRHLRRVVKDGAGDEARAVRRGLARLELDAERHVQRRLVRLAESFPIASTDDRLEAAKANLAAYLGGITSPEAVLILHAAASLARRDEAGTAA